MPDFVNPVAASVRNTDMQRPRWVDAEEYGWLTREAGAAMNDAIAAALSKGLSEVRFSHPHYNQQTPIVLQNGIVIVGPGAGPEGEIRVAPGFSIDAQIQTPDFESAYATKPGSVLNGVIRDAGFKRIFLNGNKANVPAVSDWRKGMGFRCYWLRPVIEDVRIHSTPGIGAISAYPSQGRNFPPGYNFPANLNLDVKDRFIKDLYINDTAYEGFIFEGPSDLPIDDIFVGWPGGALQSASYNSAKQSLKFTRGGVVKLRQVAGGAGYTSATVAITSATGAGFTGTCVIVSGAVDRILVDTEGYEYSRTDTIVITGDGTGASFALHVDDTIDGLVFNDDGAEIGFVHAFNNASGWAVNFRATQNGRPRIKGSFVMGETSWGNVRIGENIRYQIAKVDTHLGGYGAGPAIMESLQIRSRIGGTIASWEEYRDSATSAGAGASSVLLAGQDNRVDCAMVFGRGIAGDGWTVRGDSNAIRGTVDQVTGSALVTEVGINTCDIDLVGNSNQVCWTHKTTNHNSRIKISNRDAYGNQFAGIASLGAAQWKLVEIINRTTGGTISYSKQAVSTTMDLTSTTEQTFNIGHNIVRTPITDECNVAVGAFTGITMGQLAYAYVSAISSTVVTVKAKMATAGSGNGGIRVQIG